MPVSNKELKQKMKAKMLQVKQHSGFQQGFSIDGVTAESIPDTIGALSEMGYSLSLSVLMRRALRFYHSYITEVVKNDEVLQNEEGSELLKAQKGV